MDPAVSMQGVGKKFCRDVRRSIRYGLADVGRNLLGRSATRSELRPSEFWALRDVTLDIRAGESFALIGPNGAGKSTLLKLISGIFDPDAGRIVTRGRVGALIEVGAGFHPLLTGRENVYLNGAILGMARAEIDAKFERIVEFSEVGEFIDSPVKNYSSGMYVRLGFAVATHADPDVLLVDEVLSVGDINFQRKSINRMHELIGGERTVIFVSHNSAAIQGLTDRAAYIDHGGLKMLGDTREVLEVYSRDMAKRLGGKSGGGPKVMRRTSGGTRFVDVQVLDAQGRPCIEFLSGQTVRVAASFECDRHVREPFFTFGVREAATRVPVTLAKVLPADLPGGLPRRGTVVCEFKAGRFRPNSYNLYLNFTDADSGFGLPFDTWDDVDERFRVVPRAEDYARGYVDGQGDIVALDFEVWLEGADPPSTLGAKPP